jgi:hypothetical protein
MRMEFSNLQLRICTAIGRRHDNGQENVKSTVQQKHHKIQVGNPRNKKAPLPPPQGGVRTGQALRATEKISEGDFIIPTRGSYLLVLFSRVTDCFLIPSSFKHRLWQSGFFMLGNRIHLPDSGGGSTT